MQNLVTHIENFMPVHILVIFIDGLNAGHRNNKERLDTWGLVKLGARMCVCMSSKSKAKRITNIGEKDL
jgi:hypothetical protein